MYVQLLGKKSGCQFHGFLLWLGFKELHQCKIEGGKKRAEIETLHLSGRLYHSFCWILRCLCFYLNEGDPCACSTSPCQLLKMIRNLYYWQSENTVTSKLVAYYTGIPCFTALCVIVFCRWYVFYKLKFEAALSQAGLLALFLFFYFFALFFQ